jgi:hypothetical protein
MTITSATRLVEYPGDGGSGPFSFAFKIFQAADLVVTRITAGGTETVLTNPTDYTVPASSINNENGGQLTLVSALAVGETLRIERTLSLIQPTDIKNQGAYYPATIENQLDRLVMIDQQQQADIADLQTQIDDIEVSSGQLTADQLAALAGTEGTPSAANPFVTDDDARMVDFPVAEEGKAIGWDAGGNLVNILVDSNPYGLSIHLADYVTPVEPGQFPSVDGAVGIQAWIDAAITAGDHTLVARRFKRKLHIDAGWYKTSVTAKIRSIDGGHVEGDGAGISKIYGIGGTLGSPVRSVLDLNGVAKSFFSNFTVEGEASAFYKFLLHARFLHPSDFPTDPDRVARGNNENWYLGVEATGYWLTAGIKLGNDASGDGSGGSANFGLTRQVDQQHFKNSRVSGNHFPWQTSATYWQRGIEVGTGSFGNPVVFTFDGCTVAYCAKGVNVSAADIHWTGGVTQTNEVDFYINKGFASLGHISGVRSEHSAKFLDSLAFNVATPLTIQNCDFHLDTPGYTESPDDYVISWNNPGHLTLDGFKITNPRPAGQNARILISSEFGSATVQGLVTPHAPNDAFVLAGTAVVRVKSLTRYQETNVPAASAPDATYADLIITGEKEDKFGTVFMRNGGTWGIQPRIHRSGDSALGIAGSLKVHGKALRIERVADPGAPTVTGTGSGAATYSYYIVCRDAFDRTTAVSAVGQRTNAPATLSEFTDINYITAPAGGWPDGTVTVDIYKGDTSTLLAERVPIEEFRFVDYGQSTSAGSAPTTNSTGGAFSGEPIVFPFSGNMILDVSVGNSFEIDVTSGIAISIQNPTGATSGQPLEIEWLNSSGGAMGAITWGSEFKMSGAFTNPANGTRRSITFRRNQANTLWIERHRNTADVA